MKRNGTKKRERKKSTKPSDQSKSLLIDNSLFVARDFIEFRECFGLKKIISKVVDFFLFYKSDRSI